MVRSMTSNISTVSGVVAKGHQTVHHVSGRVESWRADVRVRWPIHRFRGGPQSGSHGLRFQLPPPRTQRADLPLLKRSCTILIKGYGTYHTGAVFDAGSRDRRYPLKSPTRSYTQRLLHRFQPKPRRWRALPKCRRIFFSTQSRM